MTIKLNDGEIRTYENGNILNIPFNTKMNVVNEYNEVLEFFVVKAPNPRIWLSKTRGYSAYQADY